jgi:hypothetical protein
VDKAALVSAIESVHANWLSLVEQLGIEGLERAGAVGDWRVRDILAHANCWDRWQVVQLRCAFTSETPTDRELQGEIDFPPNDDMHEDAMNAMFLAGYAHWSTDDVVRHFREVFAMRTAWVSGASQAQLHASVGADWAGGTNRVIRLSSEVEGVDNPQPAWQFILNQVEHLEGHLDDVRRSPDR